MASLAYPPAPLSKLAALAALALATAGCTRPNPRYCDATHPCAVGTCNVATSSCGSVDAGTPCASSADCHGATPVCDPTSHRCVGCVTAADCATPTAPICDSASQQCRACRVDVECPSLACDLTPGDPNLGACVPAANIYYVSPGATGCTTADGSKAMPYCSLGAALAARGAAAGVSTLVLEAGTLTENVVVNDAGALTIAGAGARGAGVTSGGSTLTGSSGVPALLVTGTTSLTLRGILVTGVGGTPGANTSGLFCQGSSPSQTQVVAIGDRFSTNAGAGVDCSNCDCTVERSVADENLYGGIVLDSSSYRIDDDVIVLNGLSSGAGMYPGVAIVTPPATGSAVFANDTVTQNGGPSGTPQGIVCLSTGTVPIVNSIVWGDTANGASLPPPMVEMSPTCAPQNDDLEGGTAPNLDADPRFVRASGKTYDGDYHLAAGSPCLGAGAMAALPPVDFDGKPWAQPDVGALQQ